MVFCTAFLLSHPLDSIFLRGVSCDIPHRNGQSPQTPLTACPSLRTGGRRRRAEPGARGIPTARRCWCARKPFGAKCCAREPTGTAGARDSSTSSPATPVSAGGETEARGHTQPQYHGGLGAKRGLTGSRSGRGMGEQRGEELGLPARKRERPGRERVGLRRHRQVSACVRAPDPRHAQPCPAPAPAPAPPPPPPQGRRGRAAAAGRARRLPAAPRARAAQALVPVGAGALRRRVLRPRQDTPGPVLRGGESGAARGRRVRGCSVREGTGAFASGLHLGKRIGCVCAWV